MRLRNLAWIALALISAAQPRAQEGGAFDRLDLRVSAKGPGTSVVIDRGLRDKLAKGDAVFFRPRGGGTYRGTVTQLDDRRALVELIDRNVVLEPGTRGEVVIPRSRFEPDPVVQDPVEKQPPPDQHEPWQNQDEEYRKGMPLLAAVKPVRPEERETTVTGRFYLIGNITQTSWDDFENSFVRLGTEFLVENPFGGGGGLNFDGEVNYKTERSGNEGTDLLIQRMSYFQGGTRFTKRRWEAGRFLQFGMPEFGVLDGFEGTFRTEGGDLFGGSIGFMPEPDDDFESWQDFQIAAYYLWTSDEYEELTIGAGFQKTTHNGDFDRDLLVAKINYVPPEDLYFNATLWVDFYWGATNVKNGVDLTQAVASLGRRWDDGSWLDLSYRHQRFPDIERNEYIPILAADLDDNRYDRLTLTTALPMSEHMRFHGYIGGWVDEESSGGFAEAGIDSQEVFLDRDSLDISLYGGDAAYNNNLGLRVTYGRYTEDGRWDLLYDIGNSRQDGFPSDQDDVLQQRIRASRTFYTDSGWNLSFDAGATAYDSEWSWTLGFYIEKNF